MRLVTATLFALMFSLVLAPAAEAKRFGGGFSMGKSYHTQKRVAPATAPSARNGNTAQRPNAAANQRRPGLMGMFGGLLAGTMLGALLFGGAFSGISFIDIIIFAVIGFILFKVFKSLGRGNGAQQRTATQPDFGQHRSQAPEQEQVRTPIFGAGSRGGQSNERIRTPDWFNEQAFVEQAGDHFRALQKAWDHNDWNEIESYVDPALLAELRSQRAKSPDQQVTQVDSVNAELVNFQEEADGFVVSLLFRSWIREEAGAPASEVNEIWHLARSKNEVNANWYIVGIQQPQ